MSSGSRVPFPSSIRKTIQNIKEIVGNHSDEEVYAMLRECGMDPNETAQKLLLQDTFHEVRRKHDKRKENLNNREPADSRWRPGTQGGGSRVGRGNYSSLHMYNDTGDGRNATVRKENGVHRSKEKSAVLSSLPASEETKSKAKALLSSSVTVIPNGLADAAYEDSSHSLASELLAESGSNPPEEILAVGVNKLGIHSSTSDPELVPPLDSWDPCAANIIKREVGSQWTAVESNVPEVDESVSVVSQDFGGLNQMKKVVSCNMANSELPVSTNEKAATENGYCFMQGKMPNECKGVESSRHSESLQPSSLSTNGDSSSRPSSNHGGPSSSRPSSNYGSRAQLIGPHKVGPNKEWKPKPITSNNVLPSGTVGTSEIVVPVTVEGNACSETTLSASTSEEAPTKLKKKLEQLHFSDGHVIIPNHLHVPEAERTGLSFGSFDAGFGVCTSYAGGPDDDGNSTGLSESSQELEVTAEEPSISNQNVSPTVQEGNYPGNLESPKNVSENLTPSESEANGSFDAVPDHDHSKPNAFLLPEVPQVSVVHTAPNYSGFGLMPPVLGTQLPPFDSSEPQARDGSRHPSFVVQQSFDPSASYYTQFYRPGAHVDGRFSPLLVPGAANKYNGNIAVLSTQSGQSSHESGNSLVLSTAGPTSLVAQTAGVMQSTIPMGQQPVPIFRQPAGIISHYPPNYISYNQFYSPFLLPPPTIHHLLSNTAFPQQPSAGNVYPSPPATGATGAKFSVPQYKPGTNTGNSTLEMPTSFGPYSSFTSGYGTNTTAITGNSSGNEELSTPQYKESHVYTNGQQSEGSAIWIPAPGLEISGLQPGSFYNLPPQGQHVTFAPPQAGHSAFAGIYHRAQSVDSALEMVGPPPSVYQQPQRAQIKWTNNY